MDARTSQAEPAPSQVVATVNGSSITLAEVDKAALEHDAADYRGMSLAQALFEARQQVLDEIVADRLIEAEAAKQGVSKDDFLTEHATGKLAAVTDADVESWYTENEARLGGQPLDRVKELIRSALGEMRRQEAIAALVATLRAANPVVTRLEPPRADIAVSEDEPALGPATAAIQIVEFSDFQCPFCRAVGPTLTQLRETYGDKIRLVYKDLPLDSHPNAPKAAEAGNCAHEQGKFWALHDAMFANQRQLGVDDLKKHASAVGLDMAAFTTCLDSGRHAATVKADADVAQQHRVTATPTFFINGRIVSGAQPFESFKRVIDDELARQK